MNNNKKKQVCVNLSIEAYKKLEKNAEKRKLDKTNYITYLIQNDKDDLYSEGAANILNQISSATENLIKVTKNDEKIKPFVVGIKDGVNNLWQFLR